LQDEPDSLICAISTGRKRKRDELLTVPVLNGLASISLWHQAGSKSTLATGLAHSSDTAGAGMPNDGWLLATLIFCHLHCVVRLPWNKQHLLTLGGVQLMSTACCLCASFLTYVCLESLGLI